MSNKSQFVSTVKIQAQVEGLDRASKQIKDSLSGMKFDFAKNKHFEKIFTNFENEYKNFLNLTKDNQVDLIDVKAVQNSAKKIRDLFGTITKEISALGDLGLKDTMRLFPESFKGQLQEQRKLVSDFIKETKNIQKLKNDIASITTSRDNNIAERERLRAVKTKNGYSEDIKAQEAVVEKSKGDVAFYAVKAKSRAIDLAVKKEIEKAEKEINEAKQIVETLNNAKIDGQFKKPKGWKKEKYDDVLNNLQHYEKTAGIKIEDRRQEIRDRAIDDKKKIVTKDVSHNTIKARLSAEEYAKYQEAKTKADEEEKKLTSLRTQSEKAGDDNQKKEHIDSLTAKIDAQNISLKALNDTWNKLGSTELNDRIKKLYEALNIPYEENGVQKTYEDVENLLHAFQDVDEQTLQKVQGEIKDIGNSTDEANEALKEMPKTFEEMGAEAENLKKTNQQMDNLKTSVLQFVGYTGAVNLLKKAFHSAYETVKELDAAMTEMAVVTDLDISDYWDQLPTYTQKAKDLGVAIKDVYDATALFLQQGLDAAAAGELASESLKLMKITGQSAEESTKQLTAALRGFRLELNEISAKNVSDVYAELAAVSATDVDGIATAVSKTASIAESAGMGLETTSAFLTQIIETTQEAPETAGTALKISA